MKTATEKASFDEVEAEAYEADRDRKWRMHCGMTGEYRVQGHRADRRPMLAAQGWLVVVLATLKKIVAPRRPEVPVTANSMFTSMIFGSAAGDTAAKREAVRYRRQWRRDMLLEVRDWVRTAMLCTLCATFVALCGTLLWMVWQ
jgi:hypothetical protein